MTKIILPTKIVKTRDAANAILKKIGLAALDYCQYIEKHADGFEIFIEAAAETVALRADVAAEVEEIAAAPALKTRKTASTPKTMTIAQKAGKLAAKEKGNTVAAVAALAAKRAATATGPKPAGVYVMSARSVGTGSPSALFRKCICEGMTNSEALDAVALAFRWTAEYKRARRTQPAFYRFDARRKGLIPNVTEKGEVGRGAVGYHGFRGTL